MSLKSEPMPGAVILEPNGHRATPPFRVVGDLAGADRIMNEAVFIGTYPGLTPAMLVYMVATIRSFVQTVTA